MKSKKLLKIVLLITVMMFLFGLTSNASAAPVIPSGSNATYKNGNNDGSKGWFCMDHTKGLSVSFEYTLGYYRWYRDSEGNLRSRYYTTTETTSDGNIYYDSVGAVAVEPSVGYAVYYMKQKDLWYGAEKYTNSPFEQLQHVIWASTQWGNPSAVVINGNGFSTSGSELPIEARSYQYGTFYYGIVNLLGEDEPILKTETKSEDLKVFVNQDTKKYVIGPYKLELNIPEEQRNSYTEEAVKFLKNELIETNDHWSEDTKFAWYDGIEGIDDYDTRLLSETGEELKGPEIERDFYIELTPKTETAIPIFKDMKIKIKYLDNFTGSATEWEASESQTENNFTPAYDPSVYDLVEKNVLGIDGVQEVLTMDGYVSHTEEESLTELPEKKVNVQIGGNIWKEIGAQKTNDINGRKDDNEEPFGGIQVQLYEMDDASSGQGTLIATTTTDKNGKYRFFGLKDGGNAPLIHPLKKYFVVFIYNGQVYQSTYYKNDLTGGYSNAKDIERSEFNQRFVDIYSHPDNYTVEAWNTAYGLEQKIQSTSGDYISYKEGALKYKDVWEKFLEFATNPTDYEEPTEDDIEEVWGDDSNNRYTYDEAYKKLESWLNGMGVGETAKVIQFIKDSMIQSTTYQGGVVYPVYNQYLAEDINASSEDYQAAETPTTVYADVTYTNLYSKNSDQARYVDYGLALRESHDISLYKDVYKATVIVNGKKQDYMYDKKEAYVDEATGDTMWDVNIRAADALFNGSAVYNREVRKSEYLYDGSDIGDTDAKNLQVFVTYKITLFNQGEVNTKINEVVDYYDSSAYEFDGTLEGTTYTPKVYNTYDANGNVTGTYTNSYCGWDKKGTKLENDTLKVSTTGLLGRTRENLVGENYDYSELYLTGIKSIDGKDILGPQEKAYIYLTFKAKLDDNGKVKLDQNGRGEVTVGKRNISEVNAYSTYYVNGTTIPDTLNEDDSLNNITISGDTTPAGFIDINSNPGNLSTKDLNANGDIIADKNSEVNNRLENDTDKAPNLRVIISQDDGDTRKFKGYVYEDNRTETEQNAVIGNGKYDEGETKIDGVTLELIELIQDVDENGIFKGGYLGERRWNTVKYDGGAYTVVTEDYYSGRGNSQVILSGTGLFEVTADSLSQGEYEFKSVPAGDFFIRFIYGEQDRTVLSNTDNDVTALLGKGMNVKSYNGQDYKTTTYQAGISQDSSYNAINGYRDVNVQNYADEASEITHGKNKAKMYYYDINNSAAVAGASDAKDVYYFRDRTNNWSKGEDGNTLTNGRAEILASFERLATYNAADRTAQQREMVNTLESNTYMVAQTGVIDTEVEIAKTVTENQGDNNKNPYLVDDVDLGLVERPEAQVKTNKEITNFKLILENGSTLYDTTKSVSNVAFQKHAGHKVNYTNPGNLRLAGVELSRNSKETPELLQTVLDDELMQNATIEATYKIAVENVGEVDYLSKKFYYTGQRDGSEEVVKTNVKELVDYVSNYIQFDSANQAQWKIATAADLTGTKVNKQFETELQTYNRIITTNDLAEDLTPTKAPDGNHSKETTLLLTTLIDPNNAEDNLVYNNLAEIIATSNQAGRRMQYSISGNQRMADQSKGNGEADYTPYDLITPTEIDADSAQKITLIPPTGANRNYIPVILAIIAATGLVVAAAIVIKKKVIK